jgi:hypothetical protein
VPSIESARASVVLHRAAERSEAEARAAVIPRDDQYVYTRVILEETRADGRGASERFIDENWRSVDDSRPSRVSERGRVWTAPPHASSWPPRRYADLEGLPTDPAALRGAVVESFGGPGKSAAVDDETTYLGLMMLLRAAAVMPPGLQAAAFEALSEIPGVRVSDDAVDVHGRHGIGITRRPIDPSGMDWQLVLDRDTYDYLGTRSSIVRNDGVKVNQVFGLTESGVVDEIGERP